MIAEWLDNPIFIKHVRSRLRPRAFAGSAAITVMIALSILYATYEANAFASGDGFVALLVLQTILLGVMGATQVGASVGAAKASGILDFHRVSPQSPWELTLGFLAGAPVREYLLAALTLPFLIFCVGMGFPDFRGLVQAELLILGVSWILHAMALLGGLTLKSSMSAQNAFGVMFFLAVMVSGPMFGTFSRFKGLIDGDQRLDLFLISLPWLAVVLLHLGAALSFILLAASRKMESERRHGLSKPQAMAAMALFALLAVGGETNWRGDASAALTVLYVLTTAAAVVAIPTAPTRLEFRKGMRRARKLGLDRPSAWDDFAPNRPTLAAIGATLLLAGTLLARGVPESMTPGIASQGFPLAVATGVLVVASFGLAQQYFLLRFGPNLFAVFLFATWALPMVLGVIALATAGPPRGESQALATLIFAASPSLAIAAAAGAFSSAGAAAPTTVAITMTLLYTFVFNTLYTREVRRARALAEAGSGADKPAPEPLDFPAEPAAAPG